MVKAIVTIAATVGIAAVLTVVFVALETVTGEPPSGPGEIAVDFADSLILVAAMFVIVQAVLRIRRIEAQTQALGHDLRAAAEAGAEWRRRSQLLLRGLGEAVDAQFRDWGLTPAEAEVTALMLKGVSFKDIATARQTSEATVRQQAQAVYRKSRLSNRAELAAYFLEDVFDVAAAQAAGPEAEREVG